MKDVMLIRRYINKAGEKKSTWRQIGSAFGTNKDGSITFKIDLFPDVDFQIREREEKKTQGNFAMDEAPF